MVDSSFVKVVSRDSFGGDKSGISSEEMGLCRLEIARNMESVMEKRRGESGKRAPGHGRLTRPIELLSAVERARRRAFFVA